MYEPGPRWSAAFRRQPWAVVLPLLVLLPFALSGAVRYTFGYGFVKALASSLSAFVILAGLVYVYGLPRAVEAESRWAVPIVAVTALLAVGFTFELWWTPLFGGMPNTSLGVDVGNHVLIYQRFIKRGGYRQYAGFVNMYAIMHWYRMLFARHLPDAPSYYYALRFAHYTSLMAVPVALALVVYPVLARIRSGLHVAITALLSLPFQLWALACLIFPVLQYFQAEGFYSQVVGVYPLLFGWLAYGLLESAGSRFVACCAWVVVQRFTYGLNLADVMFTLAYLWLCEASAIRAWWLRIGAYAFVPAASYAGVRVLEDLWPLRFARGYFISYPIAWSTGSNLLLGLLLLLAAQHMRERGIQVSAAAERMWRYAGLLGVSNASLSALYFATDAPQLYYIEKYSMYGSVVVALGVLGPISAWLGHLVSEPCWTWLRRGENARFTLASGGLLALGVLGALQAYAVYRPLARERVRHVVPASILFSHFEPEVEAFVSKTLRREKKEFGGYYDPLWARMFTHNALHFLFSEVRDHFYNDDFVVGRMMFQETIGCCYFMRGVPEDYAAGLQTDFGQQVMRWYAARKECETYRPAWSGKDVSLCATCY